MDGSKAESRGPPETLTKTTAGASALYSRGVDDVGTVAPNSNSRNPAKKCNPKRNPWAGREEGNKSCRNDGKPALSGAGR